MIGFMQWLWNGLEILMVLGSMILIGEWALWKWWLLWIASIGFASFRDWVSLIVYGDECVGRQ